MECGVISTNPVKLQQITEREKGFLLPTSITTLDSFILTMPKSDTWPGGVAIETMTGMDSAGSCDSVVSMNSGFSDDSFEHLSAEERACIMFLEETIESLETEEDSGLSNDEPDRLPTPGNVATKMAHLSASMGQNKLNNVSKYPREQNGYLVPTPFILANSTSCILPKARPGIPQDKENSLSKPQVTALDNMLCQGNHPCLPPEVNVVVIPPPSKLKDYPGQRPPPSPRGPLSYEALVQLRKSASMKRTPQSPTAETRDWNRQPSASDIPIHPHHGSTPRGCSVTPAQVILPREPSNHKASPPVVFPKPPKIPSHIAVNTQRDTANPTTDSSAPSLGSLPRDRRLSDPQKVRNDALQKLGLLRDNNESQPEPVTPLCTSKSHSSLELTSARVGVKAPPHGNPTRSQPSTTSQGPRESNSRPVKSSSSFLHRSSEEQPTAPLSHPSKPSGVKAATLERSGVGLGSYMADHGIHPDPRSATLGNQREGGRCTPSALNKASEQVKTTPAAQPVSPHKTLHCPGFSVVMMPSMGEDRREALRKLGLLKD
ncbi:specifically androgen-regulated gene protein-like [Oncorhynchus mykiss]|uniref:Zgc:158258 n=1 Tax=Oncorhynchus mykiss TaxID=8022 RepID=A0A8C7UAJ3_ONCMY|nr:specifically androgen-regulated gene protein-like [Oncorhynchus mykiss]